MYYISGGNRQGVYRMPFFYTIYTQLGQSEIRAYRGTTLEDEFRNLNNQDFQSSHVSSSNETMNKYKCALKARIAGAHTYNGFIWEEDTEG